MHIVADENIPLLDAFFAPLGRITRLPGRQIGREHLLDADALLVRSVTRVDPQLLADTPVRFVGTCTIGTDHLDLPGLAAAGIAVASAPGCNARGVVEYVLSCLLTLSERTGLDWRTRRPAVFLSVCSGFKRQPARKVPRRKPRPKSWPITMPSSSARPLALATWPARCVPSSTKPEAYGPTARCVARWRAYLHQPVPAVVMR